MSATIDRALREAKAAVKAGNARAARRGLLEVIERFPANPRLMEALAEVVAQAASLPARPFGAAHAQRLHRLRATGALNEAVEEAVAWALLNQTNALARMTLGRLYMEANATEAALPHLAAALQVDPTHREARGLLAWALLQLGQATAAVPHLEQAVAQAPGDRRMRALLGRALMAARRPGEALALFAAMMAEAPEDGETALTYAQALYDQERGAEAAAVLAPLLAREPGHGQALNLMGSIHLSEGRLEAAEAAYRAGVAARPKSGAALYNLARTAAFAPGDPAIAAMRRLSQDTTLPVEERIALNFGLAKALEDLGEIDDSFAALTRANQLQRGTVSYQPAQEQTRFDDLARRFAADAPALDQDSLTPPATVPIFVLGMFRSGTTLVEQIVSAHSQVFGAGELKFLPAAVAPELRATGGPLDKAALLRVREAYLAQIAELSGGAGYVVDKLPLNFLYTGLIRKALPEARILHMQRDPVAVCWSNYKTFFNAKTVGYAWDMTDIAGYYRMYQDFMARMQAEYPGGFLNVDYARLTEAPEPEIRAILAHCGLPFEEACLRPEANLRTVRTASVRQVRSGIYTGSNANWRSFAQHMAPLLQALGQTAGSAKG